MACLNASFVCTGEEEGLHKKFESGVCALRDCRKRKDGWKGERWGRGKRDDRGGRGWKINEATADFLRNCASPGYTRAYVSIRGRK